MSRDVKDNMEQAIRYKEELDIAKLHEQRLSEECNQIRKEAATLKGIIEEGDRSRDILVRELSRQKESDNERVRDTDARKDAEINMQERLS